MTPSGLVVRPARPDELVRLGEITATAYLDEALTTPVYAIELANTARRAAEATLLAAVDGDQVLGGVSLAAYGTAFAELAGPGEHEIRMLAVAAEARGRGAGLALLTACVDRAREEGASAIVLCTQPAMRAAHRLYDRLGFVRRPEMDWRPVPDIQLLGYRLELAAEPGPP